jgi:NitT/TauT family transport system permease protein
MDPGHKARDDSGGRVSVPSLACSRHKTMMTRSATLQRFLPATMMFAGFVAIWQLAVTGLGVREYLLPSPMSVLQAMGPGEIPWTKHIWITAVEIVGAFLIAALAGVLLGAAIAWSQGVSRALTPFLVFVNTLPKVAIAPLFLIWLGYGILPNMLIGALIGFFPVVINTAVGLTQIEQDMLDLGRVFNAPKWKVFAKIRMPNAYPYILSALKVTATSAVVGAVVGEFVASQAGLGYVIITTQSSMNTPVAFAALAWISILGLLLFGAVSAMSRVLAPWAEMLDA